MSVRSTTMARWAVIPAAASLAVMAGAATATAADSTYTVELRQELPRTATTDDGGAPQQGRDGCPGIPEGQDGWHFVLPGNSSDFVTLTVTFEPGGQQVITDFGPPSDKHAYVASEPGATLTSAVAEVRGGELELFNLSHTCPAEDDSTETTGGSSEGSDQGGTTGETSSGGATTGETSTGGSGEATTGGTTTGGSGEATTGGASTGGSGEVTSGGATTGGSGETTTGGSGEATTGETTTGSTGEPGVAGGTEPSDGASAPAPAESAPATSPDDDGDGSLAQTGASITVTSIAAALLLGVGALLLVRRRSARSGS
ncbi:LPXTG cell wall anchor domain-containing protein [Allostreptomyces psammosilenae]|uniref:LPXTG-motif cell wall-anchored protein n=1 Tax=Allostreptomyces psammosilenae TaxID=1892865 RepID=A0A852ZWT6_9ACTN|nr:LPXTG cell wall anchor domain-containing protein [Allostreptomyces psammosilenae]NYI06669.1 LPXTG-motif cell wall-anchored protein [Allostreptomyces psammosilenae]